MFHSRTCEKGKTQLGIDLLYPSVHASATLFHFLKVEKETDEGSVWCCGEQKLTSQARA